MAAPKVRNMAAPKVRNMIARGKRWAERSASPLVTTIRLREHWKCEISTLFYYALSELLSDYALSRGDARSRAKRVALAYIFCAFGATRLHSDLALRVCIPTF